MQWAAATIVATNACPAGNPAFGDGFAVVVNCSFNNFQEGTSTKRVFWVTSTASAGGGVGDVAHVERQIQVFIE